MGACCVRMLQPKSSGKYKDWQGTSVSWGVQDSMELANILERFRKFITIVDEQFVTALKGEDSHKMLERPSPLILKISMILLRMLQR